MKNGLRENIALTFNRAVLGDHELVPRYTSQAMPNEPQRGLADLFLFPMLADFFLKHGYPQKPEKAFLAGYGPTQRWIKDEEAASLFKALIAYLGLALQFPRVGLAICLTLLLLPLVIFLHSLKTPVASDESREFEFKYSS